MSLLHNRLVFIGSCLVVVACLAWGWTEGGFEPWIGAAVGALGIIENRNYLQFLAGSKRNLTPSDKIASREKWRPVFEQYFLDSGRKNFQGDAIIHDVDRLDDYPETKDSKGISSWFRVGLMGTYHRGILLGLRWTSLVPRGGKFIDEPASNSDEAIKVMLIGEVPYESIESVNFDGDDYYNKPHIFCHFDHAGEPYERLFFGEEFRLPNNPLYHYREICQYEPKSRKRWNFLGRKKTRSAE